MSRQDGCVAAGSPAPESTADLKAENARLRMRLLQAQAGLEAASRAVADAQLAVARALDTPSP